MPQHLKEIYNKEIACNTNNQGKFSDFLCSLFFKPKAKYSFSNPLHLIIHCHTSFKSVL